MRERLIEDLLGSELHATLLRFLAAADEGLDESFLTPDERSAIAEMEVAGAVRRHGGRIRLEPSARQALARVRERQRYCRERTVPGK
ncbi:MAG TPA: hypothetical protein VGF40_03170 [Thermoanaerobaculia bacterium]